MRKQIKKPAPRQARGRGGVEQKLQPDGSWTFRARKRKKNLPLALGSVRDSKEAAYADLPFIGWDENGKPVDSRLQSPSAQRLAPTTPLLRDFVRDHLAEERSNSLSYGAYQRDEIIWRCRLWDSDLGRSPIDQVDKDKAGRFIRAQKKLKPLRDRKGKILLFEQDESGRADVDRPISPARHIPAGRKWETPSGPVVLHSQAGWGCELRPPVAHYIETHERPAESTLKIIGAVLSAYYEAAIDAGICQINPFRKLKYPKERKTAARKKSLTIAEAAAFHANILTWTHTLRQHGDRFEGMVALARDAGMRRGEVCGLPRTNLFPRRGEKRPYVRVDNGRVRIPGGMENSTPKTGKIREIPIPDTTYDLIAALPERRDPDTGIVFAFSTESGRAVRPDNFSRDFRRFRASIGMPQLKLHNLRHTYISLLLRAGVDIRTIMTLVGHTTERMILQIYAEMMEGSADLAVGRFIQLLEEERRGQAGDAEVLELGT